MSLTTIERVLALRGAEIFSEIAGEDLVPVAALADEVRFEPGEALVREGEAADCLCIVVEGEFAVSVDGVGHLEQRGPGGVIGEMAIVSRVRSASCTAVGDVLALRIGYDAFWESLAEHPTLALGLITTLVERLSTTMANLAALTPPPRRFGTRTRLNRRPRAGSLPFAV